MKLDIIVRTHSTRNVHNFAERYVGVPKSEVMLRCVNSLVTSINLASADIRLWILDDHSDEETLKKLRIILEKCKYQTSFIGLEESGTQATAFKHFEGGKLYGREVVYFVEDDYLHTPSAIEEMIDAYELFTKNLGSEVALFPTDYPDRYRPEENYPTRIVYGPKRHWRTIMHSTNTCMMSKALLEKNWNLFETLSLNYGTGKGITEENTINAIWREQAVLFSPIPSLALHMQFEQHKDPYVNWQEWWEQARY